MKNRNKSRSVTFLLWAFFAGAISGLLFAPKTGRRARHWIRQQGSHLSAKSTRLANRAGAQARFRAGALQGWVHKIKDLFYPEAELIEADDDTVEQRVRVSIGENPLTWDLPHINVNSEYGIVTLRGPVKTYREKENLERVVSKVHGVIEVINKTKLVA